jgi:hypothetical protein
MKDHFWASPRKTYNWAGTTCWREQNDCRENKFIRIVFATKGRALIQSVEIPPPMPRPTSQTGSAKNVQFSERITFT